MKPRYQYAALLLSGLFLNNCTTAANAPAKPALLSKSSVQTRVLLEKTLGGLMGSQPIKLADNVFIEKSTVLIARQPLPNDRDFIPGAIPEQQANSFTLLKRDGVCLIRHDQTNQLKELTFLNCILK
jgi:hypothetical protein